MNLCERGAKVAAPIIAANESLRDLHHELMLSGKKVEAAHMIEVITAAERIAREPVEEGIPQQAIVYTAL